MSDSIWDDPNVTAYILGELPPEEAEVFEKRIQQDSSLAEAVAEARSVTDQLQVMYNDEANATLAPNRREAITAGGPKSTRAPDQPSNWRLPLILLATAAGQVVFIYVSSSLADIGLLVMMTCAMCFVFGQIPLTDAIMSRYVPDEYRTRVLSIKFLLNLTAGATVLPLCGFMLQRGYTMADLFSFISFLAIPTVCAALLLPRQSRMMQP